MEMMNSNPFENRDNPAWLHDDSEEGGGGGGGAGGGGTSSRGKGLFGYWFGGGGGGGDSSMAGKDVAKLPPSLGSSSPPRQRNAITVHDEDDDELDCCPSDPFLLFVNWFHFLAGVIAIASCAINAYYIYHLCINNSNNSAPVFRDVILRCFAILLGFLMLAAEIGWRFVMRSIRLLNVWLFRGLLYIFVGVLTLSGNTYFESPEDILGLLVISIGCLYLLFQLCCLRSIIKRRQASKTAASYHALPLSET